MYQHGYPHRCCKEEKYIYKQVPEGYTVYVLVARSCLTLYNSMDGSPPDFSVHLILQARTLIGVGGHTLLQEIFLTWGSNSVLLHCRPIHYHLSHQGSP